MMPPRGRAMKPDQSVAKDSRGGDARVHVGGEEHLAEDQRGGQAVDVEVVPLDGGADEGSDARLAGLAMLFPVVRVQGVVHGLHLFVVFIWRTSRMPAGAGKVVAEWLVRGLGLESSRSLGAQAVNQ